MNSNTLDVKQTMGFHGNLQILGDLKILKLLHSKHNIGEIPNTKEFI